jgi:hypothetical protein
VMAIRESAWRGAAPRTIDGTQGEGSIEKVTDIEILSFEASLGARLGLATLARRLNHRRGRDATLRRT